MHPVGTKINSNGRYFETRLVKALCVSDLSIKKISEMPDSKNY